MLIERCLLRHHSGSLRFISYLFAQAGQVRHDAGLNSPAVGPHSLVCSPADQAFTVARERNLRTTCLSLLGSSRVDAMTPRHRTAVISGPQIRAARGFLCWDQRDLAMMARVPLFTVEQLETGQESTGPLVSAVAAIQGALEAAGIIFTNGDEPGVKLKARVKAKR